MEQGRAKGNVTNDGDVSCEEAVDVAETLISVVGAPAEPGRSG